MSDDPQTNTTEEEPAIILPDAAVTPNKSSEIIRSATRAIRASASPDELVVIDPSRGPSAPVEIPWTLQQFFEGEIDLDVELSSRFEQMPVMSIIKFRTMGKNTGRGVATIAAPDGSAQVMVDADKKTHEVQFSFTIGSMLTLKFRLNELGTMDRTRWLNLMQRDEGGLTFLWGPSRWERDYLICVSRKYFTNLYAFSPHNFQAGIRMTPDVTQQLLNWLQDFWKEDTQDDEPPALLTW